MSAQHREAHADPVALRIRGVHRSFGGLRAVDVDAIDVPRGKLTSLIGPNGAGKSTLFNIITGFERADAGSWQFEGEEITGLDAYQISRRGLVRSFQLTRLLPGSTVLQNMVLAAPRQRGERLGVAGFHWLWRAEERRNIERARSLLESFNLADKAEELAGGLSGGQRRLLEVARSLMTEPSALMLDEPLAGVNPALREVVMEHLVRLRDDGLTLLFIEHDMDAVMGLSDYVVCLATGRRIAEGTPEEVAADPAVIEAYLGTTAVSTSDAAQPRVVTDPVGIEAAPVLDIREVTAGYSPDRPIVKDVSATVQRGEIVAVIGANGAGKSTLLKSVSGDVNVSRGEVLIEGVEVQKAPTHLRVKQGLGYVPQSQNAFPSLTVLENLKMGGFSRERGTPEAIARVLDLFPDLKGRLSTVAGALSGGQRQVVAMARALVADPVLLLLDEPSAGLSPMAQQAAFEHVVTIAESGVGILIVEQNARACLAVSHRGYVLDQGSIALTGTGADLLTDERVIELYLGSMHAKHPRSSTTPTDPTRQ